MTPSDKKYWWVETYSIQKGHSDKYPSDSPTLEPQGPILFKKNTESK